jgi:hypothetical protein
LKLLQPPTARPTQIANNRQDIEQLLELAMDEEWLVRVGYVNSKGEEVEFYGDVLDVSRRAVTVMRFPRRTTQHLTPWRIQWVRIASEAEEGAHLP